VLEPRKCHCRLDEQRVILGGYRRSTVQTGDLAAAIALKDIAFRPIRGEKPQTDVAVKELRMTSSVKETRHEYPFQWIPTDRKSFATIVVSSCGFLAGASLVQLDNAQRLQLGRFTEVALAVTCLMAVAVVLHALGHISQIRTEIADASARAGAFALLGGLIGILLDPFFLGVVIVAIMLFNGYATWVYIRENASKASTISVSAVVAAAEISFLSALIVQLL
jgi:hypothetical protein